MGKSIVALLKQAAEALDEDQLSDIALQIFEFEISKAKKVLTS